MSLTKEMMARVDENIKNYTDEELLTYNSSYRALNKHYPNSYYVYMIERSQQEIILRGIKDNKQ